MTQNYYEWTERYLNSEASNDEIDGDNIDSNSSIPAASFDLPSGWSIEENEDGEVIITDSGGTTIARRDETNNQWVFDSIVSNTLEAGATFIDPNGTEYTGRVAKTTEQVQEQAIIWSDGYAPNFAGGN